MGAIQYALALGSLVGQVAEWTNAPDCKSGGLCPSEVRILPCPVEVNDYQVDRNLIQGEKIDYEHRRRWASVGG